jgi:hypothetical protein
MGNEGSASRAGEEAPSASSAEGTVRKVALVFSPIDAEVFRGRQSLGGMPVSIDVPPGEKVELVIRRDGFHATPVTVDGSKPIVVLRLQPIVGQKPAVPVPADPSITDLLGIGVEEASAAMLLRKPDAGTGKARAAVDPDAGLPREPRGRRASAPSAPPTAPPKPRPTGAPGEGQEPEAPDPPPGSTTENSVAKEEESPPKAVEESVVDDPQDETSNTPEAPPPPSANAAPPSVPEASDELDPRPEH